MGREPDVALHRLTRLAAMVLEAPIALLGFTEGGGLRVASYFGLREQAASRCGGVLQHGSPLSLGDAREDSRFRDLPLVREVGVAGYLAHPLLDEGGRPCGGLAVADRVPREWSPRDRDILADLARSVVAELEWRREMEARRAAEAHYRRLVDTSPSGIFALDDEGRAIEANPALARLLGMGLEEVRGLRFDAVLAPEDLPAAEAAFRSRLAGTHESREFECRLRLPDGRTRVGHFTTAAIVEDGRVVGAHGIVRDITEEKEAREALTRSEERYRRLFETMAQGVIHLDGEGRVTAVNPAAERILGLSAAEILDRTWPDPRLRAIGEDGALLADEDHPSLRALRTGREVRDLSMRIECGATGEHRWLRVDAIPQVRPGETRAHQVYTTFEDVTEQRLARQALLESEQQLLQYLSQIPAVVWTTDPALRFTSARGAGLRPLLSADDQTIGRTLRQVLGAQPARVAIPEHRRALAGESSRYRMEVRGITYDASVHPLRDAAGTIVGVAGVALDISEQTRLEEQLYLSQKLEAVGGLAGGVAHDFNNLLLVIQGNTDLLLMDAPEDDPLRVELEEIRRACERAAALTRQLLAFSRQQVLRPEVVDLGVRLAEMERMLHRLIGEDVRLHVRHDADAGQVRVDPGQIEQVVLNLAVNARDAMPRGGDLTISTRGVQITPEEARSHPYTVSPGWYVELAVADTGCGMDREVLRHVFEPFFTTKEKGRGTGLGLATVYGIVKQSGGYIWVETAPGEGSRFRICLPRVAAPPEPGEALALREGIGGDTGTVLVVEDEAAVREVARKILERAGYRVLEAADGAAALEICRDHADRIDLVLSDVVMPGLSGRDLIERIRPLRPESRVLYMTGYSGERLVSYGLDGEDLALIGKPFDPPTLLRMVRSVLDGS